MTVLGSFLRSLENPSVPLSDPALAEWLSGGKVLAGVNVSETRVMGVPAYFRGIAILSGTLAGLPLKVYRSGTRVPMRNLSVLDNPNPRQTPFEFWQTMFSNAASWGNMFARKMRNGADVVEQAWPIHPSRVRVEEVQPTESNPAGKVFHVRAFDGTTKTYTSWDIFHVPYLSPTGVLGVSPLQVFRQTLGVGIAADEAAARFLGNGSHISGVLQTEVDLKTEEKATALKKRWKEKLTGPDSVGDVAILDKGLKFQPVSIPPKDAELLASRKWAVTEIARMIGLPPHMLGDVERSTSWGTGIEAQVLGLVKFTLKPWCDLVEQRATRELVAGGASGSWFAEYSLEGLLRGDSKARADFYTRMVQLMGMTPNEVRVLENEEPVEGLDVFLFPKNMQAYDPARPGLPGQQGATE